MFVIGDLASLKQADGKLLPGVAPVAMQQGRSVARQIAADLAGNPRKNFHYIDKGSLATIGRAAAVAQFGKLHISGFIAWLAWLFIHIFFLIGFRNRLLVMFQWAWSYLTYERAARLITGESRSHGRSLDGICRARSRAHCGSSSSTSRHTSRVGIRRLIRARLSRSVSQEWDCLSPHVGSR